MLGNDFNVAAQYKGIYEFTSGFVSVVPTVS
jgi:hypothetical protein